MVAITVVIAAKGNISVADPEFLRGEPTPKGGIKSYYSTIFSQKLHENERIGRRGGLASLAPPPPTPIRQCIF